MKLCFICDSYQPIYDGVTRYLDYVIPALVKLGHEVTLVVPHFVGTKKIEKPMPGFTIKRSYTSHIENEGYWWAFPDKSAINAIKKADFVLIHSLMPLGVLGGFISKIYKKKIGIFVHQDERILLGKVLGLSSWLRNLSCTLIMKIYYPLLVNVYFHATKRFKQKLLDFQVPEKKIFQAKFAINRERFYDSEPKFPVRKTHNIPDNVTIALYVGRLAKEKNIENLLKAFEIALDKDPSLIAVFVGKGADWVKYTNKSWKNKDRMIFTGFVPDEHLPSYYQAADFFISASLNESSCFTVYEAMSCKLPVITSGYLHDDEIQHRENALLIDNVFDIEEITQKILLMSKNEKLREKIASAGKQLIDSQTWEKHAKSILKGIKMAIQEEI
ncbi:MAG: glycosyltransferase family 4 protein [Asgard group archaeon]|nr:glycosyltransferase family 4 protein [Asgard group archaeon]